MAFVDTLKYLQLAELDSNKKKELKKILVNHKRALQARIKSIDQKVAALERKPAAKTRRKK